MIESIYSNGAYRLPQKVLTPRNFWLRVLIKVGVNMFGWEIWSNTPILNKKRKLIVSVWTCKSTLHYQNKEKS